MTWVVIRQGQGRGQEETKQQGGGAASGQWLAGSVKDGSAGNGSLWTRCACCVFCCNGGAMVPAESRPGVAQRGSGQSSV